MCTGEQKPKLSAKHAKESHIAYITDNLNYYILKTNINFWTSSINILLQSKPNYFVRKRSKVLTSLSASGKSSKLVGRNSFGGGNL